MAYFKELKAQKVASNDSYSTLQHYFSQSPQLTHIFISQLLSLKRTREN